MHMETNNTLKITDLSHSYKNGNSINNFNLEVDNQIKLTKLISIASKQ